MIAVVSGATGLVGSDLIQKLLSSSKFSEVVTVSRRETGIQNPKLREVLVSDFGLLSQYQAKLQGDVYFSCLGTTIKKAGSRENFRKVDYDHILEFAKVARAHSPRAFVLVSAMGANSRSFIFYNRVKGETEEALKKMGFKSLVIFRPSFLEGERQEARTGEKAALAAIKVMDSVIPAQWVKKLKTPVDVLAQRMMDEALREGDGVRVIEAGRI